jgi:hypothetical protein
MIELLTQLARPENSDLILIAFLLLAALTGFIVLVIALGAPADPLSTSADDLPRSRPAQPFTGATHKHGGRVLQMHQARRRGVA